MSITSYTAVVGNTKTIKFFLFISQKSFKFLKNPLNIAIRGSTTKLWEIVYVLSCNKLKVLEKWFAFVKKTNSKSICKNSWLVRLKKF